MIAAMELTQAQIEAAERKHELEMELQELVQSVRLEAMWRARQNRFESFNSEIANALLLALRLGYTRELACRLIALPIKVLNTWLYLGEQGISANFIGFRFDFLNEEVRQVMATRDYAQTAIEGFNPNGIKLLDRADKLAGRIESKFDGTVSIPLADTILAKMTDLELKLYVESQGAMIPSRFNQAEQQLLTAAPIETKEKDGVHEPN
jgi:hypothetical protein